MSKRVVLLFLAMSCQRDPQPLPAMSPELLRIATANELDLRWSHDATSGLIAVANEVGRPGLTLVDTHRAGQTRTIATTARWPHRPVLAPGGGWIAFQDRPPDDRASLYLYDLANNREATVFRPTAAQSEEYRGVAAFSPDAKQLLYEVRARETDKRATDELRIHDLESGKSRVLIKTPEAPIRGATWARDGYIYLTAAASLKRVREQGGALEVVGTVDDASGVEGDGDSVAVADDGTAAAFSIESQGCIRIILVRLSGDRGVTPLDCGFRASWRPGSSRELLYIGYPKTGSRIPQRKHLDTGLTDALGFDPGVTTEIGASADGAVFTLTTTPTAPRAAWHVDRGTPRMIYGPFEPALTQGNGEVVLRRVTSSDGVQVPVVVFTSACPRAQSSPLVLFVHGGTIGHPQQDDTAPRWYREIQFLTHLGVTVAAVNVRGSTGYGTEYRDKKLSLVTQVDDLRAALADALQLPGTDRRHVFLLSVSSAAELTAALVTTEPTAFVGVINWVSPPDTLASVSAGLDKLPPMLWLSGASEPRAAEFARITDRLHRSGLRLTHTEVMGDHKLRSADASAFALDQIRRFLVDRAQLACAR